MDSINIEEFFVNKSSGYACAPCNSPEDYKIAESINHEMDNVRREFQAKVEASSRFCANFRFSRC